MIYKLPITKYQLPLAPLLLTGVTATLAALLRTSDPPLRHLHEALRVTSVVTLILLASLPAGAQSLDSLRELVRENHPELRALAYAYRAESTRGRQQNQLPDLEVSGGVSPMPVETRLGPQLARIGVTQMFPWPGTLAALSDLADAQARPLLEEAAARQLELIYALEATYYELVEAGANITTLQTSVELYRGLREVALSRVENSRGSSVEVYRSELEINAALRRIRELGVMQALAWTRIEELVNTPLPRQLVAPASRILPELPEALYADHPLVRIYALREEIARRALSVNALDARPEVALGVEYAVMGRRTDADPEGNGRDMIMPQFMVRFPIRRGKFDAKREEEEIRLQEFGARREAVVNELRAAVATARLAAADAADRLEFLSEQAKLTEAALQIARSEYANSRRPFDEVLRLLNELVDYRIQAIAARRTLATQTAALDRYLPRR